MLDQLQIYFCSHALDIIKHEECTPDILSEPHFKTLITEAQERNSISNEDGIQIMKIWGSMKNTGHGWYFDTFASFVEL